MGETDLRDWRLEFKPGWDVHFRKFDASVKRRILNKLDRMKQPLLGRGLKRSRYLVEEAGGYRIAFVEDEEARTKRIHFIGDHKQYQKWYSTI